MAVGVRLAAAVCVVAALIAGCSPGGQDEPEAIARRDVPFQLLDTTTTTTDEAVSPTASPITLYFVVDDRLVPITRASTDRSLQMTLLETLFEGPTPEEASVGITTAIPSGTKTKGVERSGRTLIVRLSSDLATSDVDSKLAVGQIVLTAADLPGIDRIRFELDGEPVQVPVGDGTLAEGPVTPGDYQDLL